MAIKQERLQLKLDIDTAQGVRNLTALQEKYELLIQKNKEAKGDDKATTAKQAIEAKAALDKERESMGLLGLTLKELKKYQSELNSEKYRYTEGTDQYNKAISNLNIVKARIKELTSTQHSYDAELKNTIKTQGIEATSLKDLRDYYKLLQKEISETSDFESAANKQRIADAQKVKELVDKKEGEVSGTTSFFGQIKEQLPSAVAGAFGGMFVGLAGMAAEVIGGAFASALTAVTKRARDITDIEVALNTTRENAAKIKGDLNDIKTESSVDDLKKLVVAAGDLNVAEADIKSFVTEADKIGVVMGEDFGGSVEEAVTMIAKLKGEFKETRAMNFPDAIAKIGSTLKQLNLDGPASTQGITDFLKRVGAIPDAIKPTLPQLASFGAVFEEANLSAEISGSGFTKILTVAANNAALFGKQMGMTKKEIENLINTDPNQFVIKFAQSLKGLSGTDTAKSLKAVKLESDEVFKVVGILTDNIEKLTRSQQVSNKTFQDGTLTTQIFNKYLDDEAGKISQIGKAWSRVGASIVNVLAKISGPVILRLAGMVEKGKSVEETFTEQAKKTAILETKLVPLVSKYTELAKNSNLSATAQRELNQAIGDIGTIVPGAVSAMDGLGRTTKINLGIVNDYLEKNREAAKSTKNTAISQINNINRALASEKAKILKEVNMGSFMDRSGFLAIPKRTTLKEEDIIKRQTRVVEINKTINSNIKRGKEYGIDVSVNPAENAEPPKTEIPPIDTEADSKAKAAGEKRKHDREARQKFLDESTKQKLELEAKLAFEELQATADAEEKRINIANKTAEDELKRIETQFKTQSGVVLKWSQLSQEQKDLIHRERLIIERKQEDEVVAIYKEFDEKREAQIVEQSNRAIQIAQNAHAQELQAKLKNAQNKGETLAIFNAENAILNNSEFGEQSALQIKFEKDKIALKDNQAALVLLEKNFQDEKNAITDKYIRERGLKLDDATKKDLDRDKKAKLEKLKLDLQEDELNGKNPKDAKLAILEMEMQMELSVAGLTEDEITNIKRKAVLERQGIEGESWQKIANLAIGYFEQAYSGISNIFKQSLQNRQTEEDNSYNESINRLNQSKDSELLTNRQHAKQKLAIEKEHDKQTRKIKREQFELDKAANIVQATISGIQAGMTAYAQLGPIGGAIAAALIGAMTIANVAEIANQKAPAYATGGFTDDNNTLIQKPTPSSKIIMVNEEGKEYITPNWQLNDPVAANLVGILNHRRVNHITGFAEGGFTDDSTTHTKASVFSNQNKSEALMIELLKQNLVAMNTVAENVKNISANIHWSEPDTFELEKKRTQLTKKLGETYTNTNNSLIQ